MFEEIDPAEFVRRRNAGELWQLLDVREKWEMDLASIASAVRIPMTEVPARLGELDRARPVAVICHSGVRSARVAGYLASQGFDTVANVAGGIDAWSVDVDPAVPRY